MTPPAQRAEHHARSLRPLAPSLLLVAIVLYSPGTARAAPECVNNTATIVGTEGPDQILGTSGRDVIVARGGDDVILAKGGDDVICGRGGHDFIRGGGVPTSSSPVEART